MWNNFTAGHLARAGSRCHLVAILFSMLLTAAVASPAVAADEQPGWKAGVAKVAITPTEPIRMAGYASRNKPAEGKLHELWAKALVLQDGGGKRVALVTLDVCGFDRDTSLRIRDRLKAEFGLGRDAVALCASHTHSGPVIGHNLRPTYGLTADESEKIHAYTRWMEDQAVKAVGQAIEGLKPASVGYGVGSATFAVNRRENKEADVSKLTGGDVGPSAGWRKSLKGPVDHDLPVLAVSAGGKPVAILFGYACHATTLSGYEWTGDWPGFACEAVEKAFPGATALFVAGCGADQNPIPRRTEELARAYGRQAADGVARAMGGEMRPVAGPIATSYREIDLPFGQLPSRELLEKQKASENPRDRYLARRAGLLLERLARDGKLAEHYPYPVQRWRLGDGGPSLVLLGGEVVVDYSLRLKKELGGADKVWPIAYANDVMAYIPSKRVLDEGGYEGGGAMVYYGLPDNWGPTVEETLVAEVKRQVEGKE